MTPDMKKIVFVGEQALSLDETYLACEGRLLCRDSPRAPSVLVDFAKDLGVVGPAVFVHRVLADARNPLSSLATVSGRTVVMPEKKALQMR